MYFERPDLFYSTDKLVSARKKLCFCSEEISRINGLLFEVLDWPWNEENLNRITRLAETALELPNHLERIAKEISPE